MQLDLEFEFFQRPAVELGDVLTGGSEEGFGEEESSEPDSSLVVLAGVIEVGELVNTFLVVDEPLVGTDLLLELELVPQFGHLFCVEVQGQLLQQVCGVDAA